MSAEKSRFTVVTDDELFNSIEDFRYENRYPSRSAAAVELIRLGLEVIDKKKAEMQNNPSSGKDAD